jgi:hypothetical protein
LDPSSSSPQIFFAYNGATLGYADSVLNAESDWYLVGEGDIFSGATIASNQFPVIAKGTTPLPPVSIPLGVLYLGVNAGMPNRDVFGWIQLNNTGTELIPLSNAVAYNEPGIIIGTTTPAPEPATFALLAPALFLLLRRQRSRCRSEPA